MLIMALIQRADNASRIWPQVRRENFLITTALRGNCYMPKLEEKVGETEFRVLMEPQLQWNEENTPDIALLALLTMISRRVSELQSSDAASSSR
jgi:hypothetical protein